MFTAISIILFVVCVLLVLIVLVQNSKGGGLASNFQSSTQVMGVRKTADFLEKATWILAGALLILCIAGSATISRGKVQKSELQEKVQNATDNTQGPQFPTATPQNQPTAPVTAPATAPATGDSAATK